MATVQDLLDAKKCQVWYVSPNSPVREALKLMSDKKIGAVLVVQAGKIVGIFSERDFARRAGGQGFSLDAPVSDLMIGSVYYVTPEQSVESCMALMTSKRFRHLPVLEHDQLIGIISIGDVVKKLLEEKDSTIQSLEDYIWVHMI